MTPTEAGLRERLRTLALARDWDAWNSQRLVFADYLGEQGRIAEEEQARAAWKCTRVQTVKRGGKPVPWLFLFTVRTPRHVREREFRGLRGVFNSVDVLGFAPWTLRLVRAASRFVIDDNRLGHHDGCDVVFSWCPDRAPPGAGQEKRYDWHSPGFLMPWEKQEPELAGFFEIG